VDDDHLDRCFHDLREAELGQPGSKREVRGGRSAESRLGKAKKMMAEKLREQHA